MGTRSNPTPTTEPTPRKVQRSRQLKFWCPTCGWVGRASRKCLDAGLPTCHCGSAMTEPPPQADEPEEP